MIVLFNARIKLEIQDKLEMMPLETIMANDQLISMRILQEMNARLDIDSNDLLTAFCFYTYHDYKKTLNALIEINIDVNLHDHFDNIALYLAFRYNRQNVIISLLSAEVDIISRNEYDEMSFH